MTILTNRRGELDGRGQLSATFSNVISSGKRRMAFEDQIALTRDELRQMVKAPLDKQIERLKLNRILDKCICFIMMPSSDALSPPPSSSGARSASRGSRIAVS